MLSNETLVKRQWRAEFRKRFNRYRGEAEKVVTRFLKGKTNQEVSSELSLPSTVVAAYRANYTRGIYNPYLGFL